MSSYSATSVRSTSRPTTLTAAIGVAVVSGLSAIGSGIIILAGGLQLIKDLGNKIIAKELGMTEEEVSAALSLVGDQADSLFKEAQETYQNRAYIVLVVGGLLLVSALLMHKAATWARVLVTLTALLTGIVAGLIATVDPATTMMLILCWLAVVGSLAAIVLTWLPANRQYAKSLR